MLFKNAELYNIHKMHYDEQKGGYHLCRIPEAVRLELNEKAQKSAFWGCGSEIRFQMIGDKVEIILSRGEVQKGIIPTGIVEVYQGDFQGSYQISPQVISTEKTKITITKQDTSTLFPIDRIRKQHFSPEVYRLFLPYDWDNYLYDIEGDIAPPGKGQVPDKKYLAYGSSITHGGNSSTPSGSYAHQLSEKLEMDLINLGFAGSAYMDQAVADYIAEREDWDIATLEMGINVVNQWDVELFREKTTYFIKTIAKRQSEKPIFCIDIYRNHQDYNQDKKVTLFRQTVKDVVSALDMPNVQYICGYDMLTHPIGLSADGLHPSNVGHSEIADRLYQVIKR